MYIGDMDIVTDLICAAVEDWMSINVQKLLAPQNDTEPPEELHQLSKETDRMRERAVGPGRSVTYEEWAEFAQGVKVREKMSVIDDLYSFLYSVSIYIYVSI